MGQVPSRPMPSASAREINEYADCSGGGWEYTPPAVTKCAYCGSTGAPHTDGQCYGCGARQRTTF